ncbi:gp16 family protein [Pseudomonas japonica]|uniref:Mu-like prophage protein gp16 n=1 Tax=Pseudomonas japonica TaxID=256466 RepID=A0A239L1G1_9PSED|nr:regulatory protein GemA [Pseudomonas japonica]SNT23384.1 Mu-like prophage protein gp16 [Pseudomonas japonica]
MSAAPSNANRLRLIKLIHVARRELRMDDETYRLMLSGMPALDGVTSTADLSVPNLVQVLEQLKRKGFKVRPKSDSKRPRAKDGQSRKIRSLWLSLRDAGLLRDASEEALVNFVKGATGVAALQWLTGAQASQVIEQLKQWLQRAAQEAV